VGRPEGVGREETGTVNDKPDDPTARSEPGCDLSLPAAALAAVAALPEAGEGALSGLYPFLAAPDPVVDELPFLFLPERPHRPPTRDVLRRVAVAGRLLYAQVRWLDHLADASDDVGPPGNVHSLNAALDELVRCRFAAVLANHPSSASFFSSLANLQLRYAVSLAIDSAGSRGELDLSGYVEHAKARAAPVRAPVDATLLLAAASEAERERARRSFESCAAGLQLYDDAQDVEEDFRDGRLSWIVSETLRAFEHEADADSFYEAALLGGTIDRDLEAACRFFDQAIASAENLFPKWIEYLKSRRDDVRKLRTDLRKLVSSAS
jgi:hypothetical protein